MATRRGRSRAHAEPPSRRDPHQNTARHELFDEANAKQNGASTSPLLSLPDAQFVDVGSGCVLEYIDLSPIKAAANCDSVTLVMLHGAPGTYFDFRYLIPHLRRQLPTARIVAVNFPGFGGSAVDTTRYVELLSAQRAVEITLDGLTKLVGQDQNVFLVGHSFGGHAALSLAALNLKKSSPLLQIKGLVLLAAAGMKPHRVLQPRGTAVLVQALKSTPSLLRDLIAFGIKLFYTVILPFPSSLPTSHFVAGVVRAGTTDFDAIRGHVAVVRGSGLPSFCAWSRDDGFMEEDIPRSLAFTLGSTKRLAFASAGHNIQKTRAEVIAAEVKQWVHEVLTSGGMVPNANASVQSRL